MDGALDSGWNLSGSCNYDIDFLRRTWSHYQIIRSDIEM